MFLSSFEGLKAGAQISALKPTLKCFEGWLEGTDLCRGKSGGSQAFAQPFPEQGGQITPLRGRHAAAHKGIPAVAVHRQQTAAPPQGNTVQIPAEPAVRLGAVRRWFDLQKTL